MIALQITATTPHGIALSRPWGVSLDGLLLLVAEGAKDGVILVAGDVEVMKALPA